MKGVSITHKILFIIIELSFLALLLSKTQQLDFLFNYIMIIVYVIFLAINKSSICDIYCTKFPKALAFISKTLSNPSKNIMNIITKYRII